MSLLSFAHLSWTIANLPLRPCSDPGRHDTLPVMFLQQQLTSISKAWAYLSDNAQTQQHPASLVGVPWSAETWGSPAPLVSYNHLRERKDTL